MELKPLNYEKDLNLIEKDGNKYLGRTIKNKNNNSLIMQGIGVLFNKKNYYVGYLDNNSPNGFIYKYNKSKIISFQGMLLKDYSINPKCKVITYYNNGERYKGYFINNIMNGLGTYYFSEGESFTGNFTNGKFDGPGKYFSDNRLII